MRQPQPGTMPSAATPPSVAAAESSVVPDLNPDVASDVHGMDKYEAAIRQLLTQEKFSEIDRLAAEARSSKARFPGGFWKLHTLYRALNEPLGGTKASETEWRQHISLLELWMQHYPDSITSGIALAEAYHGYGWKARGGEYADAVTDEGWRLLAERAQHARQLLEQAKGGPEKCPEWFVAMISIARTQEWDSDKLGALFQQAVTLEPDYYYYYRMMADALLPKWGGEEGDAARFAEAVANRTGGKKGDLYYYEIATTIVCACDNKSGLNGMSWERIKAGYQALQEFYGVSISNVNQMASMAFMARDLESSRAYFKQVGDRWDSGVWLTRTTFENRRLMARLPLIKASLAQATDNGTTSEGLLYGKALLAEMDKRYHQSLSACVKTIPNFSCPLLVFSCR